MAPDGLLRKSIIELLIIGRPIARPANGLLDCVMFSNIDCPVELQA